MSKTKTKRMVASFLLLCAMSGTSAFAMPDGWNPGDDLALTNPSWIDSNNTVTINDVFVTNKGSETKPPIYMVGSHDHTVNVDFTSNWLYVSGNHTPGGYGGGAMYFGAPNWQFSDNNQVVTFEGVSNFYNNSTGTESLLGRTPDGGAIYSTSKMIFEQTATFDTNKALGQPQGDNVGGRGGAIYSNAQTYFNKGATFTDNEASSYGGAIYVGNQGELTINGGSQFSDNKSGVAGGAIYAANKVTLDSTDGDITFSGNTANGVANDIYLVDKTNDNPLWGPASSPASLVLRGSANSIIFNGSILGEAATTITNTANDLVLNGDNSDYQGIFTQTSGKTLISGNGKFFGGSNIHQINGGELVLAAAKAIDGSKIAINNDANINVDVDTTMNENISGNGNI